jgi:hypothetical protein
MVTGEASHYPAVLRAGGRGEAEPQWGKWGGERTAAALASERGWRQWHGRILSEGWISVGGAVGKAMGRSFARGALRSEDGEGENRAEAWWHQWSPFMAARCHGRGKG